MAGQSNSDETWYVSRNQQQHGPYAFAIVLEAVRKGIVTQADLVWRPGWKDWQPAGSIPELSTTPARPKSHLIVFLGIGAALVAVVLFGIFVTMRPASKETRQAVVAEPKHEQAGIFRFTLPAGFRAVSAEKLQAIKQSMLQQGIELARSSGLADAQGYTLGDVFAYESPDGGYLLTLASKEEKDAVREDDVRKANIARIDWLKGAGRILGTSRVVSGPKIDQHPTILTEIFAQSGRLQSYDIFVAPQPRHRHTLSLIHTKGVFDEQMVKDFLASVAISIPNSEKPIALPTPPPSTSVEKVAHLSLVKEGAKIIVVDGWKIDGSIQFAPGACNLKIKGAVGAIFMPTEDTVVPFGPKGPVTEAEGCRWEFVEDTTYAAGKVTLKAKKGATVIFEKNRVVTEGISFQ